MSRGVLLIAGLGLLLAGWLWLAPAAPTEDGMPRTTVRTPAGPRAARPDGTAATIAALERQVRTLQAQLTHEAAERQRLAERLDAIAVQLAAPSPAAADTDAEVATDAAGGAPPGASVVADAGESAEAAQPASAIERALLAAGIDAARAADIRQRQDDSQLAELYLRDQATREGWLGTPRFAEAMAELEAERVAVRDEIGDAAYDRYLAALGHPNRVRVDEVMSASPAAAAGLQSGDIVLRYGAARIFQPDDLVTETRAGMPGELVTVEVLRAGQRLTVSVPRGPLGLRIAGTRGDPDDG